MMGKRFKREGQGSALGLDGGEVGLDTLEGEIVKT